MSDDKNPLIQKDDKELLMQKHNNVHKTFCGLLVAWIIGPVWLSIKFEDMATFLTKSDIQTIIAIFLLFTTPYLITIWAFYYKCNEYEHLIKYHCPVCEGMPAK